MVMKIKKIGKYLLDNQACEQKDVTAALEKQFNLESLRKYKSMGEIMVASHTLAPEDLEMGLHQQWTDMLSAADLFKSLSVEHVRQIALAAEDRTIPKNTILFSQGDPGETYWLVISGGVKIYRHTE